MSGSGMYCLATLIFTAGVINLNFSNSIELSNKTYTSLDKIMPEFALITPSIHAL